VRFTQLQSISINRKFFTNSTAYNLLRFVATRYYIAPEVLRGSKYDGKQADMWSMGVLLNFFILGEYPVDPTLLTDSVISLLIVLIHKIRSCYNVMSLLCWQS
jgi:serine/threonine protein kinase